MGLAAGQARLLTITGRKSDCEFESMRLSHQKIALARDLAALSNEYQNSLDQTKLIYDFYGTGDTAMELSYGILMQPSALNNYKSTLITDSMNRVVLNSKYAAAAQAAGIPREGLSTLPSETLRNRFIAALANKYINDNGQLQPFNPAKVDPQIISDYLCTTIVGDLENGIIGIPYNQGAGFGNDTSVSVIKREMSLTDLCDYIRGLGETADVGDACSHNSEHVKQYSITTFNQGRSTYDSRNSTVQDGTGAAFRDDAKAAWLSAELQVNGQLYTIGDIILDTLENGTDYMLSIYGQDDNNNCTGRNGIVDYMCNFNLWDQMFDTFEDLFNDGEAATEMALQATREKIRGMLTNPSVNLGEYDEWDVGTEDAGVSVENWDGKTPIRISGWPDNAAPDGKNDFDTLAAYIASKGDDEYDSWVMDNLDRMTGYVGMCVVENNDNHGSSDNDSDMSAGCINISRMIMAYLTEFYIQMNGTSAGDYNVQRGLMSDNKFIDGSNMFTIVDREVSSDNQSYAAFYDTIFNMICKNGWCENKQIDDPDYLQNMLQNGMVYISKQKDDNFYYQGNYAIDPYIKEVADETLIARAEAHYNTEKAKLNAKEETLDLKMKNLDTEISSLTTEYDTVKNTISKQIEKSFKRYSA